MADVKQIYDIVNVAANMVLGKTAIVAVDTSTFVSLGEQITADSKLKDMFNDALTDVIGRTITSIRPYEDDSVDGMVRDGFTYGMILRKIYVDVPDAEENPAYEVGKSDFVAEYLPINKPTVKEYLFSKTGTFEMGVTIPDDLWDSAFHSESEVGILISAIYIALDNRYKLALTNLKRLCRATYMANVINSGGIRAVDLLNTFNTAFPDKKIATQEAALSNKDFLLWSSMTITQYTKRFRDMSTIFNAAGNLRHTPRDMQVLTLIENYTSAVKYNLQSDIYHEEMIALPRYNEVNFWQGTGTGYSFRDASTISVKVTTDTGTTDLTFPYVLGALYDVEAMGVTIDKLRDKKQYYPHEEVTNYWKKATRGYFCDMSENGVVFYLGTPATTGA